MRWVLSLILLWLCVPSLAGEDVERCRTLFTHVVEEKRAMSPADIADYLASAPGTNPIDFSTWPSPTARHVYQGVFEGLLNGPEREAVEAALRSVSRILLGTAGASARKEKEVAGATAAFPLPTLVRQLPAALSNPGRSTHFVHDGRPHLALGVGEGKIAVVDLTDDSHHMIRLPVGNADRPPLHLEVPGQSYLAFAGNASISTSGRDERGMGMFTIEGRNAGLLPASPTIGNAADGPVPLIRNGKLWFAVIDAKAESVALVPVGQPRVDVVHLAKGDLSQNPHLNTWYGKKETLFLVPAREGGFLVINPETNVAKTIGRGLNTWSSNIYTLDEKPMALIVGKDGAWGVDAHDGKPVKLLDGEIYQKPCVFERNGSPMAIVEVRDQKDRAKYHRQLLNLRTKETRELGLAEGDSKNLRHFEHAGHDYAVWGTLKGEIVVLDLTAGGEPIRRKVIAGAVHTILPIPMEDGVGAIITTRKDDPPFIVRLFATPK